MPGLSLGLGLGLQRRVKAAGGGPTPDTSASVIPIALLTDTTNDSTHTFNGVNFGTPSADRIIVLEIAWRGSSTTLDAVSIGGVTATRASRGTASASGNNSEIYYAEVPSGSTGDIVLQFSASVSRKLVKSFICYGLSGSVPEDVSGTSGNSDLSLASAGPAVLFALWNNALSTVSTWLDGPYEIDRFADLGSGTTSLSANFGMRAYSKATAITGDVLDSNASQKKAAMVWPLPSPIEGRCEITDQFSDATDQTTVTTAALDIGSDKPGRMVVVAFAWAAAASRTISSVTIGGVTATAVAVNATASGGVAIYKASGVTGTSASVVVTFSGTVTRCSGTLYRTTPASTTEVDAVNAGASSSTLAVDDVECKAGGFVIMIGREASSSTTVTTSWNGVDSLRMDKAITTETMQSRAGFVLTSEDAVSGDLSIASGTANAKNGAAASWL